MSKKGYIDGKKRIEVRFDEEKDADVIQYIEENGYSYAGFLKMVAKEHVRKHHVLSNENSPETKVKNTNEEKTVEKLPKPDDNSNTDKKIKKRLPIGLNAISSKDLDKNLD